MLQSGQPIRSTILFVTEEAPPSASLIALLPLTVAVRVAAVRAVPMVCRQGNVLAIVAASHICGQPQSAAWWLDQSVSSVPILHLAGPLGIGFPAGTMTRTTASDLWSSIRREVIARSLRATATIVRSLGFSPILRLAVSETLDADPPFRSVVHLSRNVQCHRTTLYDEWHLSGLGRTDDLTIARFVDAVLLARAIAVKPARIGWRHCCRQGMCVRPERLNRIAEWLTGAPLSVACDEGFVNLIAAFDHRVTAGLVGGSTLSPVAPFR